MEYKIILTVGIVLFGVFAILFIITIVIMNKYRLSLKIDSRQMQYLVACAGTPSSDSNVFMDAPSINTYEFRTKTGKPIDPTLYYQFVVEGNSMKFCGIKTGSLIFVKKGFTVSQIEHFPVVLVLKRMDAFGNSPQYKVRRAWTICKMNSDTDFSKILQIIMNSGAFQEIKEIFKKDNAYDSDEYLIEDFMDKRLPIYQNKYIYSSDSSKEDYRDVVISTTYDTVKEKIHFSIHPVSSIVGIVSESYSLADK